MFPCKFYKIFQDNRFTELLQAAASWVLWLISRKIPNTKKHMQSFLYLDINWAE